MRTSVTVRVPGSTSNLGAGFDCVGVAIDRWIRLTVQAGSSPAQPAVTIERRGTLEALAVAPDADLIYHGFLAACRRAGRPGDVPRSLWFSAESDVPVTRGLGSSAAAVVAGAAAANALLDLGLSAAALTAVGSEVEGHPDNVAPAIYGGANLVLNGADGLVVAPLALHPSLAFAFAVPALVVETKVARGVLPESVPHARAALAAAKGAALVHGLAHGDPRLLHAALDDVLHVPYRRSLVPGYDAVTAAARQAGAFGATLSGSGPTILALAPADRAAECGRAMVRAWDETGVRAESFVVTRPAGGCQVV